MVVDDPVDAAGINDRVADSPSGGSVRFLCLGDDEDGFTGLDRVVRVDRKRKNATSKEERRRVVSRMDKIVKLDAERRELEKKLKKAQPQHATQTRKAIDRRIKSLGTETKRLALHPSQVTKMSARIGELVDKCRALEDEIETRRAQREERRGELVKTRDERRQVLAALRERVRKEGDVQVVAAAAVGLPVEGSNGPGPCIRSASSCSARS